MSDLPPEPEHPGGRLGAWIDRLMQKLRVQDVPHIKRIVVTSIGGTVLIFGVALIFLPGPAVIVIPAGLAILGTEYAWARRWLNHAKTVAKSAMQRTQAIGRRRKPEKEPAESKL